MTTGRNAWAVFGAVVLLNSWGVSGGVHAQDLPRRVYDRCIRSAVSIKILMDGPDGARVLGGGSGTLIDPRGYVLTNFHVVGRTEPGHGGLTGDLYHSQGYVLLGMVGSDREQVQHKWVGQVVRGDPNLDLALVRIIKSVRDDAPVRGRRFPFIRLADFRSVRGGEAVWAIGFPLDSATVNVTAGNVSSFAMNHRGEVAWLRTDAEFNPGNSGGMLVDKKCRLVGVPTAVMLANSRTRAISEVERARPVSQIPREWLRAMRSRRLVRDLQIRDVPALDVSRPLRWTVSGDQGDEHLAGMYWFHLPALRPARVVVDGARVALLVRDKRGRKVAEGVGSVRIPERVSPRLDLMVQIPPGGSGTRLTLHFLPEQPAAPRAVAHRAPEASSGGRLHADLVPLGPGGDVAPAPRAPAGRVRIVGRVVDAAGRPVSGAFLMLGKPGVDLEGPAHRLGRNEISRAEFQRLLVGQAQSDASGHFVLSGASPGTRHMIFAASEDRGIGTTVVMVPSGQAVVRIPPVQVRP